jgi:hypothetical protein
MMLDEDAAEAACWLEVPPPHPPSVGANVGREVTGMGVGMGMGDGVASHASRRLERVANAAALVFSSRPQYWKLSSGRFTTVCACTMHEIRPSSSTLAKSSIFSKSAQSPS